MDFFPIQPSIANWLKAWHHTLIWYLVLRAWLTLWRCSTTSSRQSSYWRQVWRYLPWAVADTWVIGKSAAEIQTECPAVRENFFVLSLLAKISNRILYPTNVQMEPIGCSHSVPVGPRYRSWRVKVRPDAHQPHHHEGDEGPQDCQRWEGLIYYCFMYFLSLWFNISLFAVTKNWQQINFVCHFQFWNFSKWPKGLEPCWTLWCKPCPKLETLGFCSSSCSSYLLRSVWKCLDV